MKLFDDARATALMASAGVDLLLASSRPNVGYLSDYWYAGADEFYMLWDLDVFHYSLAAVPRDPSRGAFLVLGSDEKTVAERNDPWIKERHYWGPGYYIRTWDRPDPDPGDPMDTAAGVLRKKGLDRGVIAVEMRYLGARYLDRLRGHLPAARFVDAEPIFSALRIRKTPEEQRRLREAGERTAAVWHDVSARVRVGQTEIEIQAMFARSFAEHGMVFERAYVVTGPSGHWLINGTPLPTATPLLSGRFLRCDIQGRYEGYLSNMSRVMALGKCPPDMESAHEYVCRMMDVLASALRPGTPVARLRELEVKLNREFGGEPLVSYTGHGIGRIVHEAPYLYARDTTVLEPGMTLTLEPGVVFEGDGEINVCLEDEFLITADGAECLTQSARRDLYMS